MKAKLITGNIVEVVENFNEGVFRYYFMIQRKGNKIYLKQHDHYFETKSGRVFRPFMPFEMELWDEAEKEARKLLKGSKK